MKTKILTVLFAAVVSLNLIAQIATPGITSKQNEQQSRINQGIRSGELTPRETRKLDRQQAKIQADKRAAKADGVVTPRERRHIKKEQERADQRIYSEKHDFQRR